MGDRAIRDCKAIVGAALAMVMLGGPAEALTIYVANEKDDSISVIDGDTLAAREIPVGRQPRGLALSKDGAFLFIAAGGDDAIQILDTTTLKVVDTLAAGARPEALALSPDGSRLYVANEDDDTVTVIDTEARLVEIGIPVGVEPEGVAASPDGMLLVNTTATTDDANFIDARTFQISAHVTVAPNPRRVAFTPDGAEVWVTSESGTVSVIDSASREVEHEIGFTMPDVAAATIQPAGIAISADGAKAFVALGPANRVAVIDAQQYQITHSYAVGEEVWQLALSPDGQVLYTTNRGSDDVSVIDLEQGEVTSVAVGDAPWGHRGQAIMP